MRLKSYLRKTNRRPTGHESIVWGGDHQMLSALQLQHLHRQQSAGAQPIQPKSIFRNGQSFLKPALYIVERPYKQGLESRDGAAMLADQK